MMRSLNPASPRRFVNPPRVANSTHHFLLHVRAGLRKEAETQVSRTDFLHSAPVSPSSKDNPGRDPYLGFSMYKCRRFHRPSASSLFSLAVFHARFSLIPLDCSPPLDCCSYCALSGRQSDLHHLVPCRLEAAAQTQSPPAPSDPAVSYRGHR